MLINKARPVISSVASGPLPEGDGNSNSGDVDCQVSYFCWAEMKRAIFGVPTLMWGHKLLPGRSRNPFRSMSRLLIQGEGGAAAWGRVIGEGVVSG